MEITDIVGDPRKFWKGSGQVKQRREATQTEVTRGFPPWATGATGLTGNLGRSAEHTWELSLLELKPWGYVWTPGHRWLKAAPGSRTPRTSGLPSPMCRLSMRLQPEEHPQAQEEISMWGMANRPGMQGTPETTDTSVQGAAPSTEHARRIMTVKRHTCPVLCTT